MIKINWICFCNHTGYGQAAQGYLDALLEDDEFDVRIEPIGGQIAKPFVSDERFPEWKKLTEKEMSEDRIQVFHCIPTLQSKFKKTRKNIGFATFETFEPPDLWVDKLNGNDGVIVPSQFNYHIFAHSRLRKPLFYIPHALDFKQYHPAVEPMTQHDKFTFLFFGSWRLRKGYPQLLEAWFSEFGAGDNVQLIVKTDRGQMAQSQTEQIRNKLGFKNKETAPILFENKVFGEDDLPRFLKSVQCLIAPSLGEGFHLPGLQCMSLGIPIIITDFSGCKDYANEQTATLIPPRGYVMYECLDRYPQFRRRKFAFVAVKDIKEKMRWMVENYGTATGKAANAVPYVAKRFNHGTIRRMFREMLTSLYHA